MFSVQIPDKSRRHLVRLGASIISLALLGACASTGATFRSGVGDAFLEHAPYYAGASLDDVARLPGRIAHIPISFQRGASQADIFDPRSGAGSQVDAFIADMNRYLDSLGVSVRVAASTEKGAIAPDVRFGCAPALGIPGNDCAERGDSVLGRNYQTMQLSVGRPSPEWIEWAQSRMNASQSAQLLVISLEVGQYLLRQEGLRGTKVLELGSGNVARLPWLTSLETPVSVLQLTGALVGQDGKAIRIGAEGFHARRTRLAVSAMGAQELLSEDDVRAARTARRDDLPGSPLAWQVALRELVTRVTARGNDS